MSLETKLYCIDCKAEHDLNKGPDVGICLECGGFLIEANEVPDYSAVFTKLINDGLLKSYILRGRAEKGKN